MKILVSDCLLGKNCRYDGGTQKNDKVLALCEKHTLIGCCCEQLGGLPTPRVPGEIVGDLVLSKEGKNLTENYLKGGQAVLKIAKENNVDYCIFKQNSPSCGCGRIYDGTFSGNKIIGDGTTTKIMKNAGYKVITEEDL